MSHLERSIGPVAAVLYGADPIQTDWRDVCLVQDLIVTLAADWAAILDGVGLRLPQGRPGVVNSAPDNRIRPAVDCRSFAPGHTVHVIQWSKAFKDPATRQAATVLGIDETYLGVRCDDLVLRLSNHDLDRVKDLLTVHGEQVQLQRRWGVLWFGSHLISIRDAETGALGPCRADSSSHGWLVRPEHYDPSGSR